LSKTKSPEPSGDKKVHVSSVSVPKTIELKPVEKKAVPVPKRPEKRILNTDDLEKEQKMYLEGLKCYSQGKFSEALKMFEQVLKINPDNEKAKKNIEQIIQKEKK
jgi:tetratricopeptide (TPR) repeat protein